MSEPAKRARYSLKTTEDEVGDVILLGAEEDVSEKSKFGKYFQIIRVNNIKRGTCRKCGKSYKMTNGNTSGLGRHVKKCYGEEVPKTTQAGIIPTSLSPGEDLPSKDYVDWAASKYLPFQFFDDPATQEHYKKINPSLNPPKRKQLKKLTLNRHRQLKNAVAKILKNNNSRIAFTTDGWSGTSGKSYYGITAHYIDEHWQMQSLTLDFVPSHGCHAGIDIAKAFNESLKSFGIEGKIIGVTVDNVSANTCFVFELEKLLPGFNAIDMHFRCASHIINLAVQDFLKRLKLRTDKDPDFNEDEPSDEEDLNKVDDEDCTNSVTKIRSLCCKIRKSEKVGNQFQDACKFTDVPYKRPILDCRTRWNSTWEMMSRAIELKKALNTFCQSVPDFQKFKLIEKEWQMIEGVCKFLLNLKRFSDKVAGEKYATLPTVVVAFNLVFDKIESLIEELDKKRKRTEVEENLLLGYRAALAKMLKHYAKTNYIYCVALILDPRFKLETFGQTEWGRELLDASKEKFDEIYEDYKNKYSVDHPEKEKDKDKDSDNLSKKKDKDLIDFDSLYKKPVENQSEYELYLALPREVAETDILEWWRNRESQFPVLAKMARDFLAICATSVPSERLFSKAANLFRKNRNRLSDESCQSQLCINSWKNSPLFPLIEKNIEENGEDHLSENEEDDNVNIYS